MAEQVGVQVYKYYKCTSITSVQVLFHYFVYSKRYLNRCPERQLQRFKYEPPIALQDGYYHTLCVVHSNGVG
jgi:hypothetical protein